MRKFLIVGLLLMLAMVVSAQATPLTYGQPFAGSIDSAGQTLEFTFNGTEGDTITISMKATMVGLDSYLELYDPGGNFLTFDDDSGAGTDSLIGPFKLPTTGTYILTASSCCGGNGTSTGPFELLVAPVQTSPLTLNESYSLELTDEQPIIFFSYTSAGEEILSLNTSRVEGTTGVTINVQDSNGNMVNQGYAGVDFAGFIDPLFLSQPGDYQIIVQRDFFYDGTGNPSPTGPPQRLSMVVRKPINSAYELGTGIQGALDDNNPTAYYTFAGSAGDILRVVGDQGDSSAFELQLYGTQGYGINGGSTIHGPEPGKLVIDPVVLDTTGSYLVVLRRASFDGQVNGLVSAYSLTINSNPSPVLENGIELTDKVGGETFEKIFRFEGTAGQTIRVTLRSLDENYGPGLNVFGPPEINDAVPMPVRGGFGGGGHGPGIGGRFIMNVGGSTPGTVTYELALPADGTYLFRVNNGIFSPQGPSIGSFGIMVIVVG